MWLLFACNHPPDEPPDEVGASSIVLRPKRVHPLQTSKPLSDTYNLVFVPDASWLAARDLDGDPQGIAEWLEKDVDRIRELSFGHNSMWPAYGHAFAMHVVPNEHVKLPQSPWENDACLATLTGDAKKHLKTVVDALDGIFGDSTYVIAFLRTEGQSSTDCARSAESFLTFNMRVVDDGAPGDLVVAPRWHTMLHEFSHVAFNLPDEHPKGVFSDQFGSLVKKEADCMPKSPQGRCQQLADDNGTGKWKDGYSGPAWRVEGFTSNVMSERASYDPTDRAFEYGITTADDVRSTLDAHLAQFGWPPPPQRLLDCRSSFPITGNDSNQPLPDFCGDSSS